MPLQVFYVSPYKNVTTEEYLEATVDKTFVIQLLEHPPNAFHERRIHSLIVVCEVNPTTQPRDVLLHFPQHQMIQILANYVSVTQVTVIANIIYKQNSVQNGISMDGLDFLPDTGYKYQVTISNWIRFLPIQFSAFKASLSLHFNGHSLWS